MKGAVAMASRFGLALIAAPLVSAGDANPLGKVVQLMDDLAAKITKEGEAAAPPNPTDPHATPGTVSRRSLGSEPALWTRRLGSVNRRGVGQEAHSW